MSVIRYIFIKKKSYLFINIIVLLLGVCGTMVSFQRTDNFGIVLMSISTAFISGALIAFLELWRTATNDIIYENINEIVLAGGVENVYKKRKLDEYDALIEKSYSIDISGYSLRAFSQSYQNIIIEKLSKDPRFRLRMLVVDPLSEVSKNRERVEHRGKNNNVFKTSCDGLYDTFCDVPGVEIRMIDCALSTMIYRIDDIMYVGPQFVKEPSSATFTMRLKRGGWVFDTFQDEFDKLWSISKPYQKERSTDSK